jgi:hypothetical protein
MLASLESQHRPKDRVTIISGSTCIELITTKYWYVRVKTFVPSTEWRLFIHVSIKEYSSIVLLRSLYFTVNEGRIVLIV